MRRVWFVGLWFVATLVSTYFFQVAIWPLALLLGLGLNSSRALSWKEFFYIALGVFFGGLIPWGTFTLNGAAYSFGLTNKLGWLIGSAITAMFFLLGVGSRDVFRWAQNKTRTMKRFMAVIQLLATMLAVIVTALALTKGWGNLESSLMICLSLFFVISSIVFIEEIRRE